MTQSINNEHDLLYFFPEHFIINNNNENSFDLCNNTNDIGFGSPVITLNENNREPLNDENVSSISSLFPVNETPSFPTNPSKFEIGEFEDINLKVLFPKEKIFKITRKNKKIGRLKKNSIFEAIHTKFTEDNIIRKFKAKLIERCRRYINKLNFINHNKKVLIQKISPDLGKKIIREENLKFLEMKLKDVFSENVSSKCKLYKPYYNRIEINKLYEKNKDKEVIFILNKTIREMINYYLGNYQLPGFGTIDEDLNNLETEYKKEYRRVAENFEDIFHKKHSRRNK